MAKFKQGDRVAYSANFCRSIGAVAGEIPHLRGNVVALRKIGQGRFCRVQWDGEEETKLIRESNLAKVGGRGFSAD